MNKKILIKTISVIWAALLGFATAWVMWMLIYGIGSRVIQDQEHVDYEKLILLAGVIASSIVGIACVFLSRRPFLSAFLIHLVVGINFVIIPVASWQSGVWNYFVTLGVWTVITVWMFRRKPKTELKCCAQNCD